MESIRKAHERFLPTRKDKVLFYTGLVCVLVAVVMTFIYSKKTNFDVPLWIMSTVVAGLSLISILWHNFTPPSRQYKSDNPSGITQVCADLIRDKAVATFIIFAALAALLKSVHKFNGMNMTLNVELVLIFAAIAMWQLAKF